MATSYVSPAYEYPGDYPRVFDACIAALGHAGFKVSTANPQFGKIFASSGVSLTSWGENVTLTLGSAQPGSTLVQVHSATSFGLTDWGRNKKHVDRIVAAISQACSPG